MIRFFLVLLCALSVLGSARPARAQTETPKTQPPYPGLVYIEMQLTGMR